VTAISGVDTKTGIKMTGGTEEGYYMVLSAFCRDALKRLEQLETKIKEDTGYHADELSVFITNFHAIKSSSASIGAVEVSVEATRLESAGKNGDIAFIRKNIGKFTLKYSKLIKDINSALKLYNEDSTVSSDNIPAISALLQELGIAIKSEKAQNIDLVLGKIYQQPLDVKTKQVLDKVSNDILMMEFDDAAKKIGEFYAAKIQD